MKISRIEIKDFHQFQDFELDLTYPKGHEKSGQPLDKVCFIGQSGTGKTTLLKVCKEIVNYVVNCNKIENKSDLKKVMLATNFSDFVVEIFPTQRFHYNKYNVQFSAERLLELSPTKRFTGESGYVIELIKNQRIHILHFNILSLWDLVLQIPKNGEITQEQKQENDLDKKGIFTFNDFGMDGFWNSLKENVVSHTNEKSKYRFAISKAAEEGNTELTQKKVAELKQWEEENPNPLEDLAVNFLNPILKEFGLKTKIEIDSLAEAEFINFIDRNDNTVPQSTWSTGTKQIVFKVLPLYTSKPENAIILIDEPENSLYPNIQTKIIDHYLRLAPTCQFFVATHSPIIAASFEPWEIVELKFNEEGNVEREFYYDKKNGDENHVDNYFIDPRYYKYGTVLKEIFDLEQEGPDSDFRNKEMMRASRMEATIKRLNKEGKREEALKVYEEYKELARKLDWEVNI